MKVRYVGNRPREVAPATGARGFTVKTGDVVDVDDATGRSLMQQTRRFAEVTEPKPAPKPAEKKEHSNGDA